MLYDFSTDVKEEPEWEDYCISEAQARASRGVKREPALEPPTHPIASTDANAKTDSITSKLTSKNNIEKKRNSLKPVKEESETKPWLEEWAGLYSDRNEENLSLRLDLCSGASVNVEIKSKREGSNEPRAPKKPKVANSRRDLMAINDVAREVNRKRNQPDKEPFIINKYINNVLNPVPTTNSHQETCYLGISQKGINETQTATNEKNLQEVRNMCKIVIINPEADQSRQSLRSQKTHQVLNSKNLNKNQSLSINSIAHTETGRALGSETLQLHCGTKTVLPRPTPMGVFRPIRAPIQKKLKKSSQHINVPISRLGNNVYLKPLNQKTVTIPNSQNETVKSQTTFNVFTVLESQTGIPKLKSTVSGIHDLQPIPKLLNSAAPTSQSAAIPIVPKLKHLSRPISKSTAEVISQPNILNGKLREKFKNSGTNTLSVNCNLERVSDGNIKIAVACGTKTNTNATPVKVTSSAVPIHFQKIAPKPISKSTMNFSTPKPNDNNLFHIIADNNGQLEVQNKPNKVTAPNFRLKEPNIQVTSPNMERIFHKPILKLTENSHLQKENGNNIQVITPNIQQTAPNFQLREPNIQVTSPNIQRIFPKPISKLTENSQHQKANGDNLLHKVDNNNRQPDKSGSNLQLSTANVQRIVPKPISKLITNSQIPKPNNNNLYIQIGNDNQQSEQDNNASNIRLVSQPEIIDDSTISRNIIEDYQPKAQYNSTICQITPKSPLKPVNSVPKSVDNNHPGSNDSQHEPAQANPSYVQPLLLEYLHTADPPPLIPFEKPINSIAKSNINPIPQKSYGRSDLKPNLQLNYNTQPPYKAPKLEDPVKLSKQHDQLKPNQNLPVKTEDSKKVPKLEDFLTPSYVKLDQMRKRTCKVCKQVYYDRRIFLDHMIAHFGSEGPDLSIKRDSMRTDTKHIKRLTCHCQRRFNEFKLLHSHTRRMHMAKRYYCDYCSKGLADKRSLMNHMRTHTGERPYRCSICERHYRTESNLVSHKAVHSQRNQKHYCPICDRPFHMVCALNKHLKIHSGRRPHVCVICKQTFVEKHHLQRHMDSHLDERRFSCDHCKMKFLRKSHLVRHITSIHGWKLKKEARKLKKEARKRRKLLSATETHEVMESQMPANDT